MTINKIISGIKPVKIFIIMAATSTSLKSQPTSTGIFDGNSDIGKVRIKGSVSYNPQFQEYTIQGSGTNMWFDNDEFHYLWKKIKDDFIVRANVQFVGKGVEPHRKIGWIIRQSLDSKSKHVNACIHGDGLTSLQYRRTDGGQTEEMRLEITVPDVIQLERKGNNFIMSVAKHGELLTSVKLEDVQFPDEVYAGIYICSHNPDVSEKATFRNVRIILPSDDDFVPYKDYIGSHIEIMDIGSGLRKIIYTSPLSLQAPNWTPDGKSLIYNSEGKLFSLDLSTLQPAELNTDFAIQNNNDHVLSSDGKFLGISHHSSDDDGKSIIYTLPSMGGVPQRVTKSGPSYLHGWSPDNKYLVYTAERNGEYDIYKIPASGGEEIQLTNNSNLDDGSEYTPDGKFIYFNSDRNGKMQIWRMDADGNNQVQVTSDEFNNWFPHISPDGKWIVFLTFPPDIDPGDHPFYKHVYLRIMPAAGGNARVLAYVYGGQGTINVPSWSPDSKKIAFVSNSKIDK